MLSSLLAIAIVSAAPAAASPTPPPPAPPTPQAAARVAVRSMPPPGASTSPRLGESLWLPATYSLSQDPGFTPWSTFLTLGHDGLGTWTLEGSSLGAGLRCGDLWDRWCQPLATATLALVWQPDNSWLAFFVGPSMTSQPDDGLMRIVPAFVAGLRITTPSLASLVDGKD